MLHKTRGIVLSHLKYKETSIIVNVYTEEFGIQTYIENGVRSARSKNKIALFQPLSLLDLIVYKKNSGTINRISEIKCNHPYQSLPYQVVKSSIAIFLAELLGKILKGEEESNPYLFNYIFTSLLFFDHQESYYLNFHLKFLIGICHFLGFHPVSGKDVIQEVKPFIKVNATAEHEGLLDTLIASELTDAISLNPQQRRELLQIIIAFLQIHISEIKEIKSLKILQEVLSK